VPEKEITSYTCEVTTLQADQVKSYLHDRLFTFREVPYAFWGAAKGKLNVTAFKSGKLLVQGKDTKEWVEFFLEPEVLKKASLGYELELAPEQLEPRIGIDESGKGDFFGPLVIASVYVNESIVRALKEIGVKDSKLIKSDKKIEEIAKEIKRVPGCLVDVIALMPETYNRLYGKMRNVNEILGWGHASVLENLLCRVDAPKAISDQFARTEWTIKKHLKEKGKKIEFHQRHKAESDYAVAAASIIAREEFVRRLRQLGTKAGIDLPKGASSLVKKAAAQLIKKSLPLDAYAKMHFKTSSELESDISNIL